jgi:multidrug efflux pump subunit AcrA (membrane-fusion protein)
MQAQQHSSDHPPALTTNGAHAPKPPARGGVGALVVVGLLLALGVPVGMKIKAATAARKAMEAERAKAAQAAEAKGADAKTVTTVRPRAREWLPVVPFDGTLMAAQEVDLAFRQPGTIAKVNAKTGDHVDKNALLAALDTSDLAASRAVASAQVKSAEVQLSLAHDNDALTTALIRSARRRRRTRRSRRGTSASRSRTSRPRRRRSRRSGSRCATLRSRRRSRARSRARRRRPAGWPRRARRSFTSWTCRRCGSSAPSPSRTPRS